MFRVKGINILCMEDDPLVLSSVARHLRKRGYDTFEANSGSEAQRILKERPIDILIADIRMPDMGAFELISRVRAMGLRPKILILTAYEESDYFIEAIRSKVDGFILKPLNFAAMDMHVDALSNEVYHERELKEVSLQRDRVLDSIKEGVLCLNTKGQITYANSQALKLLGGSLEELYGKTPQHYFTLENTEGKGMGELLERVLCGESTLQEGSGTLYKKERFLAHVEFTLSPIIDKGRILGAVAALRDATLKHEKEKELKLLSLLVEQSPGNILLTDIDGKILYVNRGFEELTGFDREEVVGLTPRILKSQYHSMEFYQQMWKMVKEEGRVWIGEMKNHRKNGEDYWVYLTIYPIKDEKGSITHFAGIGKDITDKKAYEEYQRECEVKIESAVLAETAKNLERDRILFEKRRLEDMGNLLKDISHHWRQPLTAISILVQNLKEFEEHEGFDEEEFASTVEKVLSQVEVMSKSLDGFRNFFKSHEAPVCFRVKKIIEEISFMLLGEMQTHQITLEIHEESPLELCGPSAGFKQVLLSLIKNSVESIIKRREQKKIKGKISLHLRQEGEQSLIQIYDNGIGIKEEERAKLFDPYFSTKTEKHGRGMGLYIGRSILRQGFEGEICYESPKEGEEGAIFTIKIPADSPL
ncbi:PAS domain S-box protein [Wolinella succinogenes]|uniref:histidine kinase n=1 Tax=Wolinella succinogenes (strain ATCC 29543 / DSM 1740 / CCUG 13145 / JCM 31913 / LMG 7466 / NCTC 11488 / FDC 602W) TaxID=273121 RepID=Q7MQV4_WOLSU|nr:PAS domain S-box protein [Wolinella succinogenes]CAE10984.1 sensor kinase of two-component regulatory system [Wolinella succinogenes]VEG81146.1 Blue-light-activated protein [Wolinella succinogenes]HCZ19040.1 PAS domain S-box protein [Helicobacter sp.]